MDLSPKNTMVVIPDLRHRLRQLRWFVRAFRSHADMIQKHFGLRYAIDDKGLHEAFFNWIDLVDRQDSISKADRADYIVFIGGLALASLIRAKPAKATMPFAKAEGHAENREILTFWPEGFLYTNFCICAIAAVQEQEGERPVGLQQAASDLRIWWSFREHTTDDAAMAVPFLDRFLGGEPNWQFPASGRLRTAIAKAAALQAANRQIPDAAA